MDKEGEWPYLMSARVEASLQFQYGQASYAFTQHVSKCEDCNPVRGLCASGTNLNTICVALENEIFELDK